MTKFQWIPSTSRVLSPTINPLPVSKSLSLTLILQLWFVCGNINVNSSPLSTSESLHHLSTPAEFANRHEIGFLHINARSVLPKLNQMKTWVDDGYPSHCCGLRNMADDVIHVGGYNVFRTDHKRRVGGVAIYVSNKFHVSFLLSQLIPRQLELLALHITIANIPLKIILYPFRTLNQIITIP